MKVTPNKDHDYIVFEKAEDWDGNPITIVGRYRHGDKVTVSEEFRKQVARTNAAIAAQLCGVQTIDAYHFQYRMTVPPRYWTSGLALYTVAGCNWLITDDQLSPATAEDYRKETLSQINQEIRKRFGTCYDEVQPILQAAVWNGLKDQESPTVQQISETLERVIARRLGVKGE